MNGEDDKNSQCEKISEFEKELSNLRKITSVSQSKFGEKIGLSRQFISDIELGKAQMAWSSYVASVKYFMINGNDAINAFVSEHEKFIEQYMKNK